MEKSNEFLCQILDAITEHIVVINALGEIVFVNKSWSTFGSNNSSLVENDWKGLNYLATCDKASASGDSFGTEAASGIRSVIEKHQSVFYFEYPCHSPDKRRWFMMRVSTFHAEGKDYFVISHRDITERKLAEEKAINLARMDGLTNISNRRTFDEFLYEEWRRCLRLKKPITLAIVDLDHFKLLNDTYGHQVGDECLIKVAELLKEFAGRPSDISARYGGEEFALVWGDTSLQQAEKLCSRLLEKIVLLKIPNCNSPTENYLTASIGLATVVPNMGSEESELIRKADNMLYRAKGCGRNRIECEYDD